MLFVAEYELNWDALDAVVAKKMDWNEIRPDGFRSSASTSGPIATAFRGIAVIEATASKP